MPASKKPGWITWRSSAARGILLRDLLPDGALHGMDDVDPKVVFRYYKRFPEFENVVLSQFTARLQDHRKQNSALRALAARDEKATLKDRTRLPRDARNDRGKLVFDLHPAKELLRRDVENRVHKHFKPRFIHQARREYKVFDYQVFKHRIYQEVRRQKFLRYLDSQRRKEFPSPTGEHTKELARHFIAVQQRWDSVPMDTRT